mgnify:CR=1 FL=1
MDKRVLLLTFILLVLSSNYVLAIDNESISTFPYEIVEKQLDNLNLDEITKTITKINSDTKGYFNNINFKSLIKGLITGERVLDPNEIIKGILSIVMNEAINNIDLLGKLLLLAIISAILVNLQNAFSNGSIATISNFVCYIILISIVIKSFIISMDIAKSTIDSMVVFMQALIPILITLLMAVGGITSSALLNPMILGSLGIFSTLIKNIIIPLIFFSTILGLVSKISDKVQINKISGLLREISVVALGVCLTVFMGIMSIQGATSSRVDGITIRTAKFAIDNFVPVVGGFLSDAMDTVVGCSMLLKNAMGVIGVIILFLVCIIPIVKLLSVIFIYRFTAAIIEPISDERVVEALNDVSKSLIILLGILIAVTVMFIITITIIVGAGNITLMMR